MRVFISADIEGISGVSCWRQTESNGRDYDRTRKLQALDINAAINGALRAGARDILVNDSHGSMNNLWPEDIHPDAKLLIGNRKPMSMMQGIEPGFDAVFFIGYHCRAGTPQGTLAHTYSGSGIQNVRINGTLVGETEINAGLAGYYDVPLVLVTGDAMLASQVKEVNESVETVVVKWGVTREAVTCLHPEVARQAIEEGAANCLARLGDIAPIRYSPPISFDVQMYATQVADMMERMPRIERLDNLTVRYTSDDYLEAFKGLLTIMSLCGTFRSA